MAFDFKKEYKEFYLPKNKPQIVTVPPMNYIAVRGKGDPNEEGGAYKAAIGVLYAVAYTIKMSKMGDHRIEGYYDFVVPPLEGFWWQDGVDGVDYTDKSAFNWISVIRLPDYVTKADFDLAERNARIYDPCYAATAVLSESFDKDNDQWLEIYRNIICGYDSVAHLTNEERKAIPYVIIANQFVCVAWFAGQDKYAELFETNKRMTLWLIDHFEELKDI